MADTGRALLTSERPVGPEDRLAELGIELTASVPGSPHVQAARQSGAVLHISGQIAAVNGELLHHGRVGAEVTLAQAQECAPRLRRQSRRPDEKGQLVK